MNKEFVPYEESKALEDMGFYFTIDSPCYMFYDNDTKKLDKLGALPAPLWQQAFSWFREKYKPEELNFYIHLLDTHRTPKEYLPCYTIRKGVNVIEVRTENTFREAELSCLKKLIEIAKNKINE